ncbi:uncharacterized protein METZ01_LOCUS376495, partial [marine metagenome]
SDAEGIDIAPETVRHKWSLFLELMRWSEGGACRHDAILRYFGDDEETLQGCGRCDVCQAPPNPAFETDKTAAIVRKALCGVARVHGRFGIQAAAKLLAGSGDERLQFSGLHNTPTFGILREYSEEWLNRLLLRCVTAGWVEFVGGNRPLVAVTEVGKEVIYENRPAQLILPPARRGPPGASTRWKSASQEARTSHNRAAKADEDFDETAQELFEALRAYRIDTAREDGVPPYVVASDRTLRDISLLRPTTVDELMMAHGIGDTKAERYGSGFLRVVSDVVG